MTGEKMTYRELFTALCQGEAISPLWGKVLNMLAALYACDDSLLQLLCLYFSLLDDGNICIVLDEELLLAKWKKKWDGLALMSGGRALPDIDFSRVVRAGLASDFSALPPFAVECIDGRKWLFAKKYLAAKKSIEERVKKLFLTDGSKSAPVAGEIEQQQAIRRGKTENLIITGGPGTGKTTVVCSLLWSLLTDSAASEGGGYTLYLAAPSGKAADRMKESINGSLSRFPQEEVQAHKAQYDMIKSVVPSTIHRLLSFNPATGAFLYNSGHQFPARSIFVIDEASMIDIQLFSQLLQAIPDQARLFILGDKNQLPSVEAGAVLGELLAQKKDSCVELKKSYRFDDSSAVAALARSLQDGSPLQADFKPAADFAFVTAAEKENPVCYYTAPEKESVLALVGTWSRRFYAPLAELARGLEKSRETTALQALDRLWKAAAEARILCAERRGERGVETLNAAVSHSFSRSGGNYAGQLLMITQNQKLYNLYNGDCGVVVGFKDDTVLYLMLEKSPDGEPAGAGASFASGSIFQLGSYQFYPLHLISEESYEPAYAITIHKSQGSGYDNILVFLPKQEAHPLLNRQIVYTAITRTQGSTYIVADSRTLEAARRTVIERDTCIQL